MRDAVSLIVSSYRRHEALVIARVVTFEAGCDRASRASAIVAMVFLTAVPPCSTSGSASVVFVVVMVIAVVVFGGVAVVHDAAVDVTVAVVVALAAVAQACSWLVVFCLAP